MPFLRSDLNGLLAGLGLKPPAVALPNAEVSVERHRGKDVVHLVVVLGQEEESERLTFDVSCGFERVLVQPDLVRPVGEIIEEESQHRVGEPRRDEPRPQDLSLIHI